MQSLVIEIAVATPLRRSFYYLAPVDAPENTVFLPGARVQVPFGKQQLLGIIIATHPQFQDEREKLKPITLLLDDNRALTTPLLQLMQWAADYYHYPLGEALFSALPSALRKEQALPRAICAHYQFNDASTSQQKCSKAQQYALDTLQQSGPQIAENLKAQGISQATLTALEKKALITVIYKEQLATPAIIHPSPLALSQEQQTVLEQFDTIKNHFAIALLEGITGSGKTEVYLQMIAKVLAQDKQALILVPEIGLTPQTITRFKKRFSCPMAIFHSNLTEAQRLHHWQQARTGVAKIIIGTRSALFTATASLGIIVIDEEHDLSYKQQDGLRYSARDLACMRAKIEDVPIILGSATPSLESLYNAQCQKYHHWRLTERAGNAKETDIAIIDIRKQALHEGIATPVLEEIQNTLARNEQALLFINRRGFAPSLICHDCGFVCQCSACDTRLTVHLQSSQLRCHHCGYSERLPMQCPECKSTQLIKAGIGTERLELALNTLFPETPIYRIDRDSTKQKDALRDMVTQIQHDKAGILIGTQMLAKGHHFANVTLVVILDADFSLASTDYRATERFGQLITQVAGRAGREQKPGRALIQSHYPEHPQLLRLTQWGYHRFAMDLLAARKIAHLPPFSYQALMRLEDKQAHIASNVLQSLKDTLIHQPCLCIGPMPASLQRRAHYYRYQLLIQSPTRAQLHQSIKHLIQMSQSLVKSHRQRWSIDIDPQDMS